MPEIQAKILACLPASMQQIVDAVGLPAQEAWAQVHAMRRAGVIRRYGPHGARMFEASGKPIPAVVPEPTPGPEPDPEPAIGPTADAGGPPPDQKKQKKQRKRPVILFWISGWPVQDPDRRMVWSVVWNGMPTAERELKGLRKRLGKEANFEIAMLTLPEVRDLRTKGVPLEKLRRRHLDRVTES